MGSYVLHELIRWQRHRLRINVALMTAVAAVEPQRLALADYVFQREAHGENSCNAGVPLDVVGKEPNLGSRQENAIRPAQTLSVPASTGDLSQRMQALAPSTNLSPNCAGGRAP